MVYLWRAVDAEGEVLDVLVQSKRNKHAALKLMRKLLKKYAFVPERLVTDDLRSYSAAVWDSGSNAGTSAGDGRTMGPKFSSADAAAGAQDAAVQEPGFSPEISFNPRAVYNTFNVQRHLISAQTHRALRGVAMTTWRTAVRQRPDNS